jgi:hypothetical protein
MFNSILVPLDGSRFAEAVLPAAARLARVLAVCTCSTRIIAVALVGWEW